MKNFIKVLTIAAIMFSVSACNDEEKQKQAQLQQQQYNQQAQEQARQDQQYINQQPAPAQTVVVNQQPSSNGVGELVTGMAIGHMIANSGSSRSYNDGNYSSNKSKTVINNNTYINNAAPKISSNTVQSTPSTQSTSSFSSSKSTTSVSTAPKSKYSNVFSRAKKR